MKAVGVWYPTLPTIPEEEQRWFTPNEVRLLVEAAQGQYKVLFHLAAYSGLRSGELAGLLAQDLDFARGLIRVRRSVWKGMEVCRRILKPLCKRIGITPGGMHAFRHGRVSHLQQSGVPADFTKNQVGHSSLRTTSGYTHFSADFARNTVERLASKMPSWSHSGNLDSVAAKTN